MLLGPNGRPIQQSFKKADKPPLGPSFGAWTENDITFATAPGGAILQFNLDALTLADFRAMRYNPTINSSFCVLTFMLHQIDWHIECEDKKIERAIDDMMRPLWTRLVRGLSQAFWAGYSPMIEEFENDVDNRQVVITKFKDLIPEDCQVKWKEVEGAVRGPNNSIPPKFKVYDGIRQYGMPDAPADVTLWYPLLMENGNYYGRKLLKSAFAPWYFSTLVHLFANRYYERFGEPVPIGRAPFDDTFPQSDGSEITGKQAMENIITQLRNRSTVVLPNTTQPLTHASTKAVYDYDIEYLESQMRGADFERYMTRLDEEMSLSLFTPLLLLRNADVGSHNLGVQHTQTWLWMLNALTGDMKEYIDRYVVERLKGFNFSPNAPRCEWVPTKMGKENALILQAIVTELLAGTGAQAAKVDLDEVGQALGMSLTEVKVTTRDGNLDANGNPVPGAVPPGRDQLPRNGDNKGTGKPAGVSQPKATGKQISARIKTQVDKAWRDNRFNGDLRLSFGYRKRFIQSLVAEGVEGSAAEGMTNDLYNKLEAWSGDVVALGKGEFSGPEDFLGLFDRALENFVDDLVS